MPVALPRRDRISSRLRGDDQGSVAASLIILPAVIFAILASIHLALVLHGRNVAASAAQDALHATQRDGATTGNGVQAAQRTLDLFKGIEAAQIDVQKTDTTVTVTVKGAVTTPLDGFFNTFDITVEGPVEQFYFESERSTQTGLPTP